LKKPTDSVQFRFYKPKTEKTESNRTQTKKPEKTSQIEKNRAKTKKPSQTSLNRFCLKRAETETGGFEPVSVFFNLVWLFFL
jgi:hypothetical protein